MKSIFTSIVVTFLILPSPGLAGGEGVTAFVGVDVIPMDSERLLQDYTVLVSDGRIQALANSELLEPPAGAVVVDGRGKYLAPGLADMHAHVSGWVEPGEDNPMDVANSELMLYLATGVTLLRNTAGSDQHLALKRKLDAGELLGPRLYTSSPLIEGEDAVWDFATKITDPAEADALIAGYAAEGYRQIKVYHTVSAEVFRALSEAAERHGVKIIGHVSFDVGIDLALEMRQYTIEHLRGYDFDGASPEALAKDGGRSAERFESWLNMSPERRLELAQRTVAAGTWNCPTLVINEMLFDNAGRLGVLDDPMIRYVHPQVRAGVRSNALDQIFSEESKVAMRKALPAQYLMIKALSDAGAGLLVGTDTMVPYLVPGFTPIDEMEHFVAAGLTPWQALKAGTSAPAESLGVGDELGTVTAGKQADLILLDANPLDDIGNLRQLAGVMIRGQWMDRADLMSRLTDYGTEEE